MISRVTLSCENNCAKVQVVYTSSYVVRFFFLSFLLVRGKSWSEAAALMSPTLDRFRGERVKRLVHPTEYHLWLWSERFLIELSQRGS